MFQLLTGDYPFKGRNEGELFRAVTTQARSSSWELGRGEGEGSGREGDARGKSDERMEGPDVLLCSVAALLAFPPLPFCSAQIDLETEALRKVSESAKSLLRAILTTRPSERITASVRTHACTHTHTHTHTTQPAGTHHTFSRLHGCVDACIYALACCPHPQAALDHEWFTPKRSKSVIALNLFRYPSLDSNGPRASVDGSAIAMGAAAAAAGVTAERTGSGFEGGVVLRRLRSYSTMPEFKRLAMQRAVQLLEEGGELAGIKVRGARYGDGSEGRDCGRDGSGGRSLQLTHPPAILSHSRSSLERAALPSIRS